MYVSDKPELQVTLSCEEHGMPVLSAFGKIDLHSVSEFDALLERGLSEAPQSGYMMVDLRGVEFMDLTGVKVLKEARKRLHGASPGADLLVVCDERVERWLRSTGLAEEFTSYRNLRAASNARLTAA